MTELYIAGQLVVLPESFSITIIEENPFFTKNGKYSYDITLSLLDPINAKIYKHLNRVNNKAVLPKNRTAYLVVDNEVVLNGTEVILEHTDKEVKIQLLSGNSELNFLIGGDRKVRELNLGKAEKYTGASWMEVAKKVYLDLDKVYPERNWVLTPYAAGYDTDIQLGSGSTKGSFLFVGNCFIVDNENRMPGIPQGSIGLAEYAPSHSGQVPQPYLCFIIKRIIESIGYKLEYNALEEDPIRKQAYIVHGFRTNEFAKMLPNWTVTEFFEQLELWLDAVTIVNLYDKSVKLMYNYQSAGENSEKVVLEVLDEYNVEYDEDNTPRIQSSNVAYDLDDDDYYQFMCIESRIRENGNRMWVSSLDVIWDRINNNFSDVFEFIYTVDNSNEQGGDFIAYKIKDVITIKKIDSFRPLINNKESESIDISLKIIPSSFVYTYIRTSGKTISPPSSDFWIQVPVAEDYDDLSSGGSINDGNDGEVEVENIENIQDAIEDGTSDPEEKGGSRLRLALYTGQKFMNKKRLNADSGIHSAYYPMPFVEDLYEDYPESKEERYMSGRRSQYNPFRLGAMYNDIYSKSQKIDISKTYKLSFVNTVQKDIMSVFVANNKEYRCVKIERVITERGFEKIAKGEFYPHN